MKYFDRVKRSLVKTITYRIVIMTSDIIIAYFITKRLDFAVGFTIFSNAASTLLYFSHERVWNSISWGKTRK